MTIPGRKRTGTRVSKRVIAWRWYVGQAAGATSKFRSDSGEEEELVNAASDESDYAGGGGDDDDDDGYAGGGRAARKTRNSWGAGGRRATAARGETSFIVGSDDDEESESESEEDVGAGRRSLKRGKAKSDSAEDSAQTTMNGRPKRATAARNFIEAEDEEESDVEDEVQGTTTETEQYVVEKVVDMRFIGPKTQVPTRTRYAPH